MSRLGNGPWIQAATTDLIRGGLEMANVSLRDGMLLMPQVRTWAIDGARLMQCEVCLCVKRAPARGREGAREGERERER